MDRRTDGRMLPSALSPCFAKALRLINTVTDQFSGVNYVRLHDYEGPLACKHIIRPENVPKPIILGNKNDSDLRNRFSSCIHLNRTISFQITFVPPISPLLSQPEATPESWFCDENTVDAEACGVVNIRITSALIVLSHNDRGVRSLIMEESSIIGVSISLSCSPLMLRKPTVMVPPITQQPDVTQQQLMTSHFKSCMMSLVKEGFEITQLALKSRKMLRF